MGRAVTQPRLRLVAPPAADSEALARIARGDVGALGELYDRHAAALLRFALRSAGADDAEDIVQGTFERVAKVAASYDGRSSSARSWLFGIAVHIMRERRRSFARLSRALLRLGWSTNAVAPEETAGDLQRGLATLREPKRLVLLLAEVEGFTCEEIAEMLSIPIGTVWTRLHHARRELRAFYDGGAR